MRYRLSPHDTPKVIAWVFILGCFFCSIYGLVSAASASSHHDTSLPWQFWGEVFSFTLWQAFLSTVTSFLIGLPLAAGLAWRFERTKPYLLALMQLCFVLPPLVIVMILIQGLGKHGWLNSLGLSPYGLLGIVLGHAFLNAPFVARNVIQRLESIPRTEMQLSQHLGMSTFAFYKWVGLPHLTSTLKSTFLFVFLLCINSFAIVLSLGGGPGSTTLEVAIYQSLKYEFNPHQAAWLAAVQCITTLSIAIIMIKSSATHPSKPECISLGKKTKGIHYIALISFLLLWCLPLCLFITRHLTNVISQNYWIEPLALSLVYGFTVTTLSALLCFALLSSQRAKTASTLIANLGIIYPTMVLTTGLTLLWYRSALGQWSPLILILAIQSLVILPYLYRALSDPWDRIKHQYSPLYAHLNMSSGQRLRWVYWPLIKGPFIGSFCVSTVLIMGDITVPAMLGFEHFPTLSVSIAKSLGAYRFEIAYGLAAVQLLATLFLFSLAEYFGRTEYANR